MPTTQSANKSPADDTTELLLMIAKKQPIFTTFFVCLALYGLSMMFFFNRDSSASQTDTWISQHEQKSAKQPRQTQNQVIKEKPAPAAPTKNLMQQKATAQPEPAPVKKAKPEKVQIVQQKVEAPAATPVSAEPAKKKKTNKKSKAPEPVEEKPEPVLVKKEQEPKKATAQPKKQPAKEESSSDEQIQTSTTKKAATSTKKTVEPANTQYKIQQKLETGVYKAIAGGSRGVELDLDFEEVGVKKARVAPEGSKRRRADSDSSGFSDNSLSDWDIDEEEVKAANAKSRVNFGDQPVTTKTGKPAVAAVHGYEEESYDEEEEEIEEPVQTKPEPPRKEYNLRPRAPKQEKKQVGDTPKPKATQPKNEKKDKPRGGEPRRGRGGAAQATKAKA